MNDVPSVTDPTTWALDREIVLVRVLDAPRHAVFAAWTDAEAFWFGDLADPIAVVASQAIPPAVIR